MFFYFLFGEPPVMFDVSAAVPLLPCSAPSGVLRTTNPAPDWIVTPSLATIFTIQSALTNTAHQIALEHGFNSGLATVDVCRRQADADQKLPKRLRL